MGKWKERGRRWFVTRYLLVFLFFLFFGVRFFWPVTQHFSQQILSVVAYPLLVGQAYVVQPLQNIWQNWQTLRGLQHKVQTLQAELAVLQSELIVEQAVNHHTSEVAEISAFKSRYLPERSQVVQIIARQLQPEQQVFYINYGQRDGAVENLVAVYNNCLVGKISTVYPFYSKVTLVTDRICKISAYCAGTNANGIYSGTGMLHNAKLEHVNHMSEIKSGDTILSSGEGLIFPAGFALGKIITFQRCNVDYDITVAPLIDLANLKYCLLLT